MPIATILPITLLLDADGDRLAAEGVSEPGDCEDDQGSGSHDGEDDGEESDGVNEVHCGDSVGVSLEKVNHSFTERRSYSPACPFRR